MMRFLGDPAKFLVAACLFAAFAAPAAARASSIVVDYTVPDRTDPTGVFFASGGSGIMTLTDGVTLKGVEFGNMDAQTYYASDSLNYSFDRTLDLTVNGTDPFAFSQTLSGGAGYDNAGSGNQYRETFLYFNGGDVFYDLGRYGNLEIDLQPGGGYNDGLGPDANTDIVGDVTYHSLAAAVPEPSPLGAMAVGTLALGVLGALRRRSRTRG